MKKNNNKVSQSKVKRANKNKKRLSNKNKLSSFELKQIKLYEAIKNESFMRIAAEHKNES
jgi:hypothetical protein